MSKYPLSDDTWDTDELAAITRVIESKQFSMKDEVRKFEEMFAEKVGSKYAVMSNSGSSANLLAIASLLYSGRLAQGDEIIVPAVSWSTTFFPLYQHNLKIKFIDINLETLNMDINILREAITYKTKAILCVNILGNANNYTELEQLCAQKDIILIEDNCEALGGTYDGKELGTFGLLGTFSTFYSHHLCTMEGGMTVTDDEELYHYLICIRSHGWTRNLPQNSSLYKKNEDDFYESFNFIVPGYNLRPLEIEAAIGVEQLKKWDKIIAQRRKNASYFISKMVKLPGIKIQKEIGYSSWFGFAITLVGTNEGRRKYFIEQLKKADIEVRPIVAGNFTRNAAVKYLHYEIYDSLPNADYVHDNGFFVGNHSKDNSKEIDLLYEVLSGGY